jgi:hypothetical protein
MVGFENRLGATGGRGEGDGRERKRESTWYKERKRNNRGEKGIYTLKIRNVRTRSGMSELGSESPGNPEFPEICLEFPLPMRPTSRFARNLI